MILLFLSSGLFLGWSLGANDAANIFGTAVATRMVRFRAAAITGGIFIAIGAVVSGGGPAATLGKLGAVNALGGSFMVALAAALAVLWMTRAGLPVSVSQAIVGGIIGWNLFTGSATDVSALITIVTTWVVCPVLSAAIAALLFLAVRGVMARSRIHILELDAGTRLGLLVAGAFGAYALGANNVANVMGVFVPAFPETSVRLFGVIHVSTSQQLFLVGGLAIAAGMYTYSKRVMMTVGRGLFKLSPVAALIVVLAESIVLFVFASESLQSWLVARGLPPIPLVPVSSSQAVIGAVIGIALVKGGKNMRIGLLGRIGAGWVATPAVAGVVAFLGLFFLQNVFGLTVHRPVPYALSEPVLERLAEEGVAEVALEELRGSRYPSARSLRSALDGIETLDADEARAVFEYGRVERFEIDPAGIEALDPTLLTPRQIEAVKALAWQTFEHRWMLHEALERKSSDWSVLPESEDSHFWNRRLVRNLAYVADAFRVDAASH